jgi:hypothetical protein
MTIDPNLGDRFASRYATCETRTPERDRRVVRAARLERETFAPDRDSEIRQ